MIEFVVKGKKYRLRQPTHAEITESDIKQAATYSRCLREGILTQDQMIDLLVKNNKSFEEDYNRLIELRKKITELEKSLLKQKSEKKKLQIAREIRILRGEFNMLNRRQSEFLQMTADNIADNERTKYLVFCILEDENGNRLYDDFDEFSNSDDPIILEAIRQYIFRRAGFDPNKLHPEEEILRNKGMLTDDGYLLDSEGKIVNEQGQYIDKIYRLVDKEGFLIDAEGNYIDEYGHVVDEEHKVKGIF